MKEILKNSEKAVKDLTESTKQVVDKAQNENVSDNAEETLQETSRFMSQLLKNMDTEIDI